jgi:hypothetical protein
VKSAANGPLVAAAPSRCGYYSTCLRRCGVHELKIPGIRMRHSSVVVLWWCLVANPHDGDYVLRLLGVRVECLVLVINEALPVCTWGNCGIYGESVSG